MAEEPQVPVAEEKYQEVEEMTIREYLKKLFLKSMITGVPEIVDTSSASRRCVRSVILVLCLAGFLVQCFGFYREVSMYPSVIDVQVKFANGMPLPSVTICNNNWLKRRPYCNANKEKCRVPNQEELFCKKYPYFCEARPLLFPNERVLRNFRVGREDLKEYGHTADDMIEECYLTSADKIWHCNLKDSVIIMPFEDAGYLKNCFVLFSRLIPQSEEDVLDFEKTMLEDNKAYLHLKVKFSAEEYLRPDTEVSGFVHVHSPYEIISPFYYGFKIKPGRRYRVNIFMKEENMLKSPYTTDCMDYDALNEEAGENGPRTMEDVHCSVDNNFL